MAYIAIVILTSTGSFCFGWLMRDEEISKKIKEGKLHMPLPKTVKEFLENEKA